jgi:hypothetical protein
MDYAAIVAAKHHLAGASRRLWLHAVSPQIQRLLDLTSTALFSRSSQSERSRCSAAIGRSISQEMRVLQVQIDSR